MALFLFFITAFTFKNKCLQNPINPKIYRIFALGHVFERFTHRTSSWLILDKKQKQVFEFRNLRFFLIQISKFIWSVAYPLFK